jgi:hypothetical protein
MRVANVVIACLLQGLLIAHLAVRKGIATHRIQRVAVGQLGASQGVELGGVGRQFELGGDDLLHTSQYSAFSHIYQASRMCEGFGAIPPHA